MIKRRRTDNFLVGNIGFGSDYPITIQTMLDVKTSDETNCIKKINEVISCGCDLVRLAVHTKEDIGHFKNIQSQVNTPLIADVHYSYEIACGVIKAGAKKIRINPGNMTDYSQIKNLSEHLNEYDVAVRVGTNCGSLHPKYQSMGNVKGLVYSALEYEKILRSNGVKKIVMGIKSSDPIETIDANILLANKTKAPIHIGVTESGTLRNGLIKSSYALSTLLANGIGDTIRVSLTDDLKEEILAAKEILRMLKIREQNVDVVSCPTCSRTQINVKELTEKVQEIVRNVDKKMRIAVLGCPLNGIGEGKNSDLGIAGGKEKSIILVNGEKYVTVENEQLLSTFEKILKEKIDND